LDLFDAICGRRAVRHYRRDCPSEHALRQLIDAARWAPSDMNNQSWHFTVITRLELLGRIAREAQVWVRENEPWLAENQEMRKLLADPKFNLLHHAPVLIAVSAPTDGQWTAEGCALAAQNLMLAATAQGLGSCWIGLAQGWLNSPEGRKAIMLPPDKRVIAPLVVGFASEPLQPAARRAPNITWIREGDCISEGGEPAPSSSIAELFGNAVTPG
jgi:nitroreductase